MNTRYLNTLHLKTLMTSGLGWPWLRLAMNYLGRIQGFPRISPRIYEGLQPRHQEVC